MRNCFIPKCNAICKDSPNRAMFLIPKDPEMFAKWKKVLPKYRKLKPLDKICERHFLKEHMLTTFDTVINGELCQIERGRTKLLPIAVPCLNLTECPYPKRGRKPATKNKTDNSDNNDIILESKVTNNSITSNTNDNATEIIDIGVDQNEDNSSKARNALRKFKLKINNIIKNGETTELESENIENEEIKTGLIIEKLSSIEKIEENIFSENTSEVCSNMIIEENYFSEISARDSPNTIASPKNIFENLCEDVFEIELPSTLWGIHRDSRIIAFSYFDPKMLVTSKSFVLKSDLTAELFILNKSISKHDFNDNCTTEQISQVLKNIDLIGLEKID